MNEPRRPRVGVVIGSGGIKCAAAIGLWKVLEREGIPIMPAFEKPVGLGQTSLLPWIIEQGEEAAQREIGYVKRLVGGPAVMEGA